MIRLSIIIPFFNVEKYIAECLESVFNQDFPEEEYEVICINDASPDKSRDIVLAYQKKHSNLILVEHEVNKKLGAARNSGRRIARGIYIWNVDSDDLIAPNCIGKLLKQCEDDSLDVLCFNYGTLLEDGSIKMGANHQKVSMTNGVNFIHQYGSDRLGYLCPVWRHVFRKGFLDENDVYSPEINMGEDVPYTFKALFLAKRMAFVNERWYFCRKNKSSLTAAKKPLAPVVLYEKCFKNSYLILDVLQYLPNDDDELINMCTNVAKYTFNLWRGFYEMMDDNDKEAFRLICRERYKSDTIMLKRVLSCYKYCKYILWMLGISKA